MSGLIERFGRNLTAGITLFHEGDPGREMYVIQSGKIRLSRNIRGQEKLLAELGAGEFFGEMSIINDKPRTATALVLEDSQVLVLDPRTFEAMIKSNTEIAVRMIKKLARRLDDANQQIENLLLGDANSRIVHALLQLCQSAPKDTAGNTLLHVTAGDVAHRTSVDDAKVGEVLARLERSRLITHSDGGIVVPDVVKLQEFLEFLEMRERFGEV